MIAAVCCGLIAAQSAAWTGALPAARLRADRNMLVRSTALAATLTPEESVESGREILKSGWGSNSHPWYDEQTDGVRPLSIPKPEVQQTSNWNWNWNWSFNLFGTDYTLNVFALLSILVVVGVLIYVLSKVYAGRERSASAASTSADSDDDSISDLDRVEALPFQVQTKDADLLTRARQLYEQGAFSEAIVYLYSYQLVELDKSHVIRLTKGKTNRQYLSEIGGGGARLRSLVERTMVAFEDAFFGAHTIDRQRFEDCWSQIDEFQHSLHGAFA